MSKDDYVGQSSTGIKVTHLKRNTVRVIQTKFLDDKHFEKLETGSERELDLSYNQAYYLKEMLVSFLGAYEPE